MTYRIQPAELLDDFLDQPLDVDTSPYTVSHARIPCSLTIPVRSSSLPWPEGGQSVSPKSNSSFVRRNAKAIPRPMPLAAPVMTRPAATLFTVDVCALMTNQDQDQDQKQDQEDAGQI